jgi:hypothetical protein
MADRLSDKARKYAGKIKVGSGPVPLQNWKRPYDRADRDGPNGTRGSDLRGELKSKGS